MTAEPRAPELVRRNVDRIFRLEEHASRTKGFAEALVDNVGRFVGTILFVSTHLVLFGGWVAINLGWIPGIKPFDRLPFNLLGTVMSCEAVILTALVVMTQTRMSSLADRRDHLDLQVNLTVEQETSMIIQMLDRISRKLEIPQHEDAVKLSHAATLEHLVGELHARFPDSQDELPKA